MKKYMVLFEFRNPLGEWRPDFFSNNGDGFTYDEAAAIRDDLKFDGADGLPVRNVRVEEIK